MLNQIQSKSFGHPTITFIAIPWPTYHIPDIIRCLCISTVSLINLLSSGLPYNPQNIHDPPSTSDHKMSYSIIIIITMVDHLVRPGRTVQYRGRGYSNRFYTLQRLRTLPTPWSTWPRDPIRVDQCFSNETCLTHDSPIVPPAIILPRSQALRGPCVTSWHLPSSWPTKLSQTGTPANNLTGLTGLSSSTWSG
jgi:hypothetical protein